MEFSEILPTPQIQLKEEFMLPWQFAPQNPQKSHPSKPRKERTNQQTS